MAKGEIVKRLDHLDKVLDAEYIAEEAYKVWLKNTPVRSGNARRKTRLDRADIRAEYPYAKRLNEGWSKQSPDGMSKPTEEFIQEYIRKQGRG